MINRSTAINFDSIKMKNIFPFLTWSVCFSMNFFYFCTSFFMLPGEKKFWAERQATHVTLPLVLGPRRVRKYFKQVS